jgi:hypothetical protein
MHALRGMEALIALQSKCCKYRIVAPRWHQRCHSPQDFGSLEATVFRSVLRRRPDVAACPAREHADCVKEEILHVGQSQFTDLIGGKPLGLTIAWINRRQVLLDDSVPRPDFIFADIQSLNDLVEL